MKKQHHQLQQSIVKSFNLIEFFIAILIILVIAILSFDLVRYIAEDVIASPTDDTLMVFLEKALGLVIGIEFVKMLCNHRPETIIEVLLFAIARQMIVEHLQMQQMFIGVVCIAILFAIRKFLFLDYKEAPKGEQE